MGEMPLSRKNKEGIRSILEGTNRLLLGESITRWAEAGQMERLKIRIY